MQQKTSEEIHEELAGVIAYADGLGTVARAVESLNYSLAHHAAWTDERFGKVDKRFEQVDRRFDTVEARFGGLEIRMEQGHNLILGEIGKMSARVEEVLKFAGWSESK